MNRRIFSITSAVRSGAPPQKGNNTDNEISMPDYFTLRMEENIGGRVSGDDLIYINWRTTAEINTSHFELQKSMNGKDFNLVETIMANGFSKTITRYATTDTKYNFCFGDLYYRLKLVFKNGSVSFTNAITLDLNTVAGASVYDLAYLKNQQ
ncbi:MAG: hypothetical protein WKI04_04750 [Ferruginibacter sp.]